MKKEAIIVTICIVLVLGIIGSAYAAKEKTDSTSTSPGKAKGAVNKEERTYTFTNGDQEAVQITLRKETRTHDGQVSCLTRHQRLQLKD
jgi:hypothetical protein